MAVVFVAVATFAVLLPGHAAHADPRTDAARAQAQLDKLNEQADTLIEQYDQAQDALDTANKGVADVEQAIAKQQVSLDALREKVAGLAADAYRGGGASQAALLLTADNPAAVLGSITTLNRLAGQRGGDLHAVEAASNKLAQQHKLLEQKSAAAAKLSAALAGRKSQVEKLVAQQETLTKRAQADARSFAARQAQARVSRTNVRTAIGPLPPPSGRAKIAIAYAMSQRGKPYRWGGAGPSSFDCSGLTMRAWAAAGVQLPHSSAAQYHYGHHVPKSQLKPGDLVFFGHPIHHVGIYLGNGLFVDAPHTGTVVKVQSLVGRSDYAGATRL